MPKIIEYKTDVKKIDNFTQEESTKDLSTRFFEAYKMKKHVTTAPTYTPKNFFEQIVFYDDTTNQRIYFYVNNTWRYATLT